MDGENQQELCLKWGFGACRTDRLLTVIESDLMSFR